MKKIEKAVYQEVKMVNVFEQVYGQHLQYQKGAYSKQDELERRVDELQKKYRHVPEPKLSTSAKEKIDRLVAFTRQLKSRYCEIADGVKSIEAINLIPKIRSLNWMWDSTPPVELALCLLEQSESQLRYKRLLEPARQGAPTIVKPTIKPTTNVAPSQKIPSTPEAKLKVLESIEAHPPLIYMKQMPLRSEDEDFHLYGLQAGFSLHARSVLSLSIKNLAVVLPQLVLDLHVIAEQRIKRQLIALGCEDSDLLSSHDLTLLNKALPEQHKLSDVWIKAVSKGLLWSRYGTYYLKRKDRPFGLEWIEVANCLLEGKSVTSKQLIALNNALFRLMVPFYPGGNKVLLSLKKDLNNKLKRGYIPPKQTSKLPPKGTFSYSDARHHILRAKLALQLVSRRQENSFLKGYLFRLFAFHVQYGVEQTLAARVEIEKGGLPYGHSWKAFYEILGEKHQRSDFEMGYGLHYPTQTLDERKNPVLQAVADASAYSRSKQDNPNQKAQKPLLLEGIKLIASAEKQLSKLGQ